jgi:hypothetical protein
MSHEPDRKFESAWDFIRERFKQFQKSTDWPEQEYRRMMLELLRSDIPLDASVRLMLADELELVYFPLPPAEARKQARQARAHAYRYMIEQFAKEKGTSAAKAKEEVVAFFKLDSVEALNQFLRRAEQERKKDDKNVCFL